MFHVHEIQKEQPVALAYKGKGKGKVLPRTDHEGPEGEQMCSSTLPSTSALVGGEWSAPRPSRFTPGKDPVPVVQEAEWAPGAGLDGCGACWPTCCKKSHSCFTF